MCAAKSVGQFDPKLNPSFCLAVIPFDTRSPKSTYANPREGCVCVAATVAAIAAPLELERTYTHRLI